MSASGPTTSESAPVPGEPLACTVVVDTTDTRVRRRRLVGLLTLLVVAVWAERSYRTFEGLGTLILVRSVDAYIGRVSRAPTATSDAPTTSAPASNETAELLRLLLSGPAAASSRPSGDLRTASQLASQQGAHEARDVLAWGEGIRLAWGIMMGVVAAAMAFIGLFGLIAGSPRSAALYLGLGWIIIASTLGTFVCISLLELKAGLPRSEPLNYARLALIQSAYGWFLLFAFPALQRD